MAVVNRYRFYMGPLGLLRPLPGFVSSPEFSTGAPAATHTSLSGRTTLDRLGRTRRNWNVTWEMLTEDQETALQAFMRGTTGSVLRLMDPRKRNLAPEDVSTGGSSTLGVTAFTKTGVATLAWSSGSVPLDFLGLVAGRLVWTGVTNTQTLYGTTEQTPILAGSTYRVSAYVKTTTTFKFSARTFDFLGVEGAGALDATNNASTAGAWVRLSWLYTPAAGVTSTYFGLTATGTGDIETCGWMYQIDEPLKAWTFGHGCPAVQMVPFANGSYWRAKYHQFQSSIMEV